MFHGGNSFPFLERSHFAEVKSKHIGILEDPQRWLDKREGRGLCMLVCLSIHFILTVLLKSVCQAHKHVKLLKTWRNRRNMQIQTFIKHAFLWFTHVHTLELLKQECMGIATTVGLENPYYRIGLYTVWVWVLKWLWQFGTFPSKPNDLQKSLHTCGNEPGFLALDPEICRSVCSWNFTQHYRICKCIVGRILAIQCDTAFQAPVTLQIADQMLTIAFNPCPMTECAG